MKKLIIPIAIFCMALVSCENESSPQESDVYKYSNSTNETIKVFVQDGAELPQSQWSTSINNHINEFKSLDDDLKKGTYRVLENSVEVNDDYGKRSYPITWSDDTLIANSDGFITPFFVKSGNDLKINRYAYRLEIGSSITEVADIFGDINAEIERIKSQPSQFTDKDTLIFYSIDHIFKK